MDHFLSVRRRHRLNEDETPLVYTLVQEKLRQLLQDRAQLEEAVALFRLTWRMDHFGPGRPAYPEEPITWTAIEEYVLAHFREGDEGPPMFHVEQEEVE